MAACLTVLQIASWLVVAAPAGAKADLVTIENARLAVSLSRTQKGNVASLYDKLTRRELLSSKGTTRLFTLVVSHRGDTTDKRTYLSNTDARSVEISRRDRGGLETVDAIFHDLGGEGVDCTASLRTRPSDSEIRWRMTDVKVPDDLVLEQVQFPIVVLRCPLAKGEADAVLGQTKGGLYRRVSAWKPDVTISAAQPGSLAAQFGCYYDAAGGMYWATDDTRGYPKRVWMRRTADGLEVAWGQDCFATGSFGMGFDVLTASFVAEHHGEAADWRDAADIYRAWAEKQPWCARKYLDRPDIPAWLKDGPAMVRFTREWLAQPDRIEHWMNDYWLKRFPKGTPLIVAYWGWEKVATWVTPDYFPVFPSDKVFERVVKENRAAGGHVFLWPSGYHYTLTYGARKDGTFEWDDRARFARDAEAHAVIARDGKLWRVKPSWLQGGEMACMCPGDPWTIDWLDRIAEQIVRRGAEIVQIDQVVGGSFPPCYSTKHDHPQGPGPWMADVFHRQLSTMLARCRKIEPGSVVCFEEPNEMFLQQIAVQDYRDLEPPWGGPKPERASVFNYIYHQYVPTFQSNPRRGDLRSQAYCLVNGEIPHMWPTATVGPGPLLDNGGFEKWSGNVPLGWDKVAGYLGEVWSGPCARDETEVHGGKASLRLGPLSEDETVQVSRNLAVGGQFAVGGKYRLSAWIKTRGVVKPNHIMLGTFTPEFKVVGQVGALPMPREDEGWKREQVVFTVAPGAALLRIMLHLVGPGTAWIDDMKLEQIRDDGTAVEVMRPEVPPDYKLMHQWVELYAGEGRPYLEHGRMLHPPKLEVAGGKIESDGMPTVLYNAYRAPDGSEAVVMVNASDVAHEAQLTWHGRTRTIALRPWQVRLVK